MRDEYEVVVVGPRPNSWTNKDVNSFHGVVFDNETGVVTELHLESACLSGNFNANSSLFRLHHLRYLDISHNHFDSSSFLTQLGRLTNLEVLDLTYMGLVGEIPSSISNLSRLTDLSLSENEFTGSFSPLYNLTKLSSLFLSNNHFSGNIPCSLLTMPNLSSIDLSRNHLHDSLETMICSFSSKLESLDLEKMIVRNKGLNMELEKILRTYAVIDFSGNRLQGEIPESIGLLKSLIVFSLSNNDFTGHIPSSMAKLTRLESLDLSRNQLSGNIPQELATLSFLEFTDMSHNKLTGHIPQSTQFGGQPKSFLKGISIFAVFLFKRLASRLMYMQHHRHNCQNHQNKNKC